MIAAMYLRKSRAEENEPVTETLSRHRDELTKYAASNGITIARSYDEVVSGDSLYGRPQMLKLLEELEKFEAILCMDIDRLGRGTMRDQGIIFEAIRVAGVKIVTPAKTYDLSDDMDDSLISFKALFAREEYKMIRGRLRRGLIKTLEEGCYLSNAPYGYRQARINKKPTLVIDEGEAKAVRLIFEMYRNGTGCQGIADKLHALGFRPHRGEKFNRTSIAKIIRNPVYTGKVVWNQNSFEKPKAPGQKHVKRLKPRSEWVVVEGLHEPIISEELFGEANKMLNGKYHPPYRKPDTLENPLAGVLFCRVCGRAMVRQPLYRREHTQPIIICQTAGCCMSTNQETVEKLFFLGMEQALAALEAAAPESRPALPSDATEEAAKAEITRLKAQLSKQHDLLEQGAYDIDTFLSRKVEINSRIEAATAALEATGRTPPTEVITARLRNVLEHYWKGSPYERNLLVKSVISRTEYSKPKGSGWGSLPDIEITEWRQ